MSYGASIAPGPQILNEKVSALLPQRHVLKDGTACILQRLLSPTFVSTYRDENNNNNNNNKKGESEALYQQKKERIESMLASGEAHCSEDSFHTAWCLLNHEIKIGISYPFEDELSAERFDDYFFGYDTFVLREVTEEKETNPEKERTCVVDGLEMSDTKLIAVFYVKPNWPGRSAHICNGGFLSSPRYRRRGGGLLCGERFRHLAQALQYRASIFNLVFMDNPSSMRLWEYLQYERVGVIPEAGRHPAPPPHNNESENENNNNKEEEVFVDAVMWRCDLTKPLPVIPMPWEMNNNNNNNNTAVQDPGSPVYGIGSSAPCP